MKKIEVGKGDGNLIAVASSDRPVTWHNILHSPIRMSGFPWLKENGTFNRVPERIMGELPEKLAWVAPQPSGGMIRFKTDSKTISIQVKLSRKEFSRACSQNLLSGFDLYMGSGADRQFVQNLYVDDVTQAFQAECAAGLGEEMKEVALYTPLQNPLEEVLIGLDPEARVEAPASFAIEDPILFYGSSITCGFSASRPGLTYPARMARNLDANFINFGFGGNAQGDLQIAAAIASLKLSCVVMDYDFNAPSIEYLEATHEPFFQLIREKNPELPIVIVSAPFHDKNPALFEARRKVIRQTALHAVAKGDQRVSFVDGGTFFKADEWRDFTVDLLHPNDCGFHRMVERIQPAVESGLRGIGKVE